MSYLFKRTMSVFHPVILVSTLSLATFVGLTGFASPPADPVINEYVANHAGTDTNEFVEIFGAPNTDYSTLTLLEIDGDASMAGIVDGVFPVGTTNGSGYWTTGFLNNMIENGSLTLMLVEDFSGNAGDDLDTDNDGVLDATPWARVVDDVAVDEGGSDHVYSAVNLTPGFDGRSFEPGGASRIPNGTDTDTVADWKRNNFDGAGLPGFSVTPTGGEALNTPGEPNQIPGNPVINEFVANHTGSDNHEFVELYGDPDTDYSDFRILEIEGDVDVAPGNIDHVFLVGTTDANGYWRTSYRANDIENGGMTLLLVERFTGTTGDDIDSDDDGVQDVFPYLAVIDGVGVGDGTANDATYAEVALNSGFDGVNFIPGGASRIPNGIDTDTVGDWLRNDFDGEGLPGFVGTKDMGEALNTPGTKNLPAVDTYPPAVMVDLNRTVLWPPNHKMVDIHATVTAIDETDGPVAYWLESVESTEDDNGTGDGDTTNDIQGVDEGEPDLDFSLRSERAAKRGRNPQTGETISVPARRYIVTYGAQDIAGNVGYGSACVRVPHDQSGYAFVAALRAPYTPVLVNRPDMFGLVIPSRPGDSDGDAAEIDPKLVYIGNTDFVLRPFASRYVDVNYDGAKDLAVYYDVTGVAGFRSGTPDPIGLHYESGDGADYLISDIFSLDAAGAGARTEPRPEIGTSGLAFHPNPFNPTTTVTFKLAHAEHVSLRIYNVNGQLVRTLTDEMAGAGLHDVEWNGLDDNGRQAASGVYFVRLESASARLTRKVIMLK